jgi:hypothetical protein
MGGKVLVFNRDRYFSNVLDGLILVDLTVTQVKLLERYVGKLGAETFLNYHNQNLASSPVSNLK